jgi:NAD(P)-dependent dehydrogenase (short-subunit alcohol dehydrogenase family)
VTAVQGDVSKLADLDRLFAQIKKEKGSLDIVFTNAGIAKYAPLGEITEEFYTRFSTSTSKVFSSRSKRPCHCWATARRHHQRRIVCRWRNHKFENKNERSPDEQQQYVCR